MKQNKYYDMDKVIEEALKCVREKNMLVEKCLKLSSNFYIYFTNVLIYEQKYYNIYNTNCCSKK